MLTTLFVIVSGCEGVDPLDEYRSQGAPIVQRLTPDSAIIGVSVALQGEGFLPLKGEGKVTVNCKVDGGAQEAVIDSWSDTVIQFRVPTSATLNARFPVSVVNDNGVKCPYDVYLTVLSGLPEDLEEHTQIIE